ncbi:MAG: carboxymuconolactone decarboxylase family protein [Flavobacteriaceae bacterium]
MANEVEEFNAYREKMNSKILAENNTVIKTKELLGLVASTVLRCDDCVRYHLEKCHSEGLTKEQIAEALSIATLVGGTIVIPHLRRAYEYLDVLEA